MNDKTPDWDARGAIALRSTSSRAVINEIVHGKRAIPADTALRLSRALGLTDMFWIINATEG